MLKGCIEFMRFEEDFRFAAIYGLLGVLASVIICSLLLAVRLFVLIKEELLYLYD